MGKKTSTSLKTEQQKQMKEDDYFKLVERFNLATHVAQIGIWDLDIQKNELIWDDQMYKLYGLHPGDFNGAYEAWLSGVHPEDRARSDEEAQQALRGEKEYDTEFRVLWPDGSVHWLKTIGQIFQDQEGNPFRVLGINYDITARKQAELNLREHEAVQSAIVENAGGTIWYMDTNSRLLAANSAYFQSVAAALGHEIKVGDVLPPAWLPACIQAEWKGKYERVLAGETIQEETTFQTVSGVTQYREYSFNPIRGANNKILGAVCFGRDITERKQAEEKQRESEKLLRTILENSHESINLLDLKTGRYIFMSPSQVELTGFSMEELNNFSDEEALARVHPDDREISVAQKKLIAEGKDLPKDVEYRWMVKNGEYRWFSDSRRLVRDEQGIPVALVGVSRDITERKLAGQKIKENEEKFHALFENIPLQGVIYRFIRDAQGDIIDWELSHINPLGAASLGQDADELIGKRALDLFGVEVMKPYLKTSREVAATGKPQQFETHFETNGHDYLSSVFLVGEDHYANISVDITQRKRAEEALHFSQLELQEAQSVARVGSWKWNIKTKQITWSDEMYNIFGIDKHSYTGRLGDVVSKVIHPDDLHIVLPSNAGAIANEPFEYRIILPDQSIRHIWAKSGEAIMDSKGKPIFLTGIAQDITERKQAEQALLQANERLSLAQQASAAGIWDWDMKTGKLNWTSEFFHLFGLDPDKQEATFDTWRNALHPDDVQMAEQRINDAARTHTPLFNEYRIVTPSDDIRWIGAWGDTVYKEHGEALRMSGICIDITERKQAEQRLRLQYEIARILAEAATLAEATPKILQTVCEQLGWHWGELWSVDHTAAVLHCVETWHMPSDQYLEFETDTWKRTFQAGEGLPGKVWKSSAPLWIVDISKDPEFPRGPVAQKANLQSGFAFPIQIGTEVQAVATFFNHEIREPDKNLLEMFTATGRQIGQFIERKQAEAEIRQLNAELEQRVKARTADLLHVNAELEHANRTKDEFLANMSHELRTPLTGILGLTESLLLNTYGEINEKQSKVLNNVETSGHHLLELINDILDLSKIEAGKFDIYPEMLNIEETCRASLIFVREQATKKSISLEYQEVKDVKSAFADPRRLKQILVNLLSNAVKFTPEKGKVTLAVRADPEKKQIHFSVADTGIGIAKENLDRLFSPFTQVDSRLNRQYEGSGLGLVLVLRLAEMHGGNVQVETEPGKGSRFTVSLPWHAQVSTPIEATQAYIEAPTETVPNINGVVLLVEDNAFNVEAIGEYLKFKCYTLVLASNGIEALVKAEESNPDLILMDIQMPVMDGLEATRRLRADPRFKSTPIIALTALAMTGDRQRCIEAGATDYLSKPVSLKELAQKIEKLLQP